MKPKNILLFNSTVQQQDVSVYFQNGTFWLTQKSMAELFAVGVPAVSKHLKNIFETEELKENATVSKMEIVQEEGGRSVTRIVEFYRLEAVLAVGYRVNSIQATEFRKWATQTLNEFIIKGFVMDDERLKQGKNFGQDYFDAYEHCLNLDLFDYKIA
ncbi:MAG TPA: RhuM family protein [Crocinitomicaceae bacterium]|nr:RhuM family protein [Crocinitomicaceae bacterium]